MPILKDEDKMPFGRHKDKKLIEVPAKDLIWYRDNNFYKNFPDVGRYVEDNLDVLRMEIKRGKK